MSALKRLMPFNAEQAVNILSEFGPLVLMFIVNAMYGISAGTWALIISTVVAIVAMLVVLRRLPIFPLIASTVTVVFGGLTIITHDPMWVQIKVTIFNAMFAAFLFGGLYFKRNFFKYVFEKTFHYTEEGWDKFTWNFAWFFVFTAFANEVVRLTFKDERVYDIFGLADGRRRHLDRLQGRAHHAAVGALRLLPDATDAALPHSRARGEIGDRRADLGPATVGTGRRAAARGCGRTRRRREGERARSKSRIRLRIRGSELGSA